MARVESLITKFTDLPAQDQFDFIKKLRERRRTKPENLKAKRKNAKGKRDTGAKIKGSTKNISPNALAATMTKEQKLQLLRELGEL